MLAKIQSLAKQHPEIDVLWLYGSRATGTADVESDFDLAIAYKDFIKDPLERSLRPEKLSMEWTSLLKLSEGMISIVDINNIPTQLAWEIISKGRVVHDQQNGRSYREFDRICREYENDILYHRKQYG